MTTTGSLRVVSVLLAATAVVSLSWGEPQPGDIFREYKWITNTSADFRSRPLLGEQGRDYVADNMGSPFGRAGGQLDDMSKTARKLPDMDLDGATKAEAVIEKVLCHDGTWGLAIAVNDNAAHTFPESDIIPSPQQNYQHHFFPEVDVDLSELKASGNTFKLSVGGGTWWAQNLIYGVTVRVYYEESKAHADAKITSPVSGQLVGLDPEITVEVEGGTDGIERVEYVGLYEDFNYKGDGNYRQWQYRWERGAFNYNLGTATEAPYSVTWKNEWVPDQPEPMEFAARIVDGSGLIYMTEAVKNLKLGRSGLLVELCKPYNIPEFWVTRKGTKSDNFKVEGELDDVKAAKAMLCVWEYEHDPTFSINGKSVGKFTTKSVVVNEMAVPTDVFTAGENTLTVNGGGEHGCEMNWPGIVPIIQYEGPEVHARASGSHASIAELLSVTEPASGRVVVAVAHPAQHRMEIVATNGRLLYSQTGVGPKQYSLDRDLFAPGVYVIRVVSGQVAHSRPLVIGR